MKKNVEDIYPLSPIQEGMLFQEIYSPEEHLYLVQIRCVLEGDLQQEAFREAWTQVVARHPALRTGFVWKKTPKPLQLVGKKVAVPFRIEDLSTLDEAGQRAALDQFLVEDRCQGFDLSRAPLLRLALFRWGPRRHAFVWTLHHLVVDGWSYPMVLGEVLTAYEAIASQKAPQLASRRPFRDYVSWLKKQNLGEAEAFWRSTLEGVTEATPVGFTQAIGLAGNGSISTGSNGSQGSQGNGTGPGAPGAEHPDPPQGEGSGALQEFLSEGVSAALEQRARGWKVTLNTVIEATWGLLLARYGRRSSVVFGAISSGRPPELDGVEGMIGLFVNTLPVRVEVAGDPELGSWLQGLQRQRLEARRFEYSPLAQVQKWSGFAAGEALFESAVSFQNHPLDSSLKEARWSLAFTEVAVAEKPGFPIILATVPGRRMLLEAQYQERSFSPVQAQRLLGHLRQALGSLADGRHSRLGEISLLSAAERHQLMVDWNSTAKPFSEDLCLHDLFRHRAAQQPEAVAVVWEGGELSYGQLDVQSDALAAQLRSLGIKTESLVALCVGRSPAMVVGLLGILKAGGAYLPLDPAYPAERLAYMLEDSGAAIVVTEEAAQASLPETPIHQVLLGEMDDLEDPEELRSRVPEVGDSGSRSHPESLAYAIYTSGSTGRPKGVLISHRSVVNYTEEMVRQFGLSRQDRILQFASLSFDVVVEEVFPALLAGAAVVLSKQDLLLDVGELQRTLEEARVTGLELPAAYWHEWEHSLATGRSSIPPSLRFLLVGCEKPSPERLESWSRWQVPLIYVFGLTETTITTTLHRFHSGGDAQPSTPSAIDLDLPIGRPVANTQVFVLDGQLDAAPVEVAGELFVGGEGVGRGYLGRPGLTAQRFIPNPFAMQPGQRLYRTGDLARFRAGGELGFLGRLDHQVKIRGNRVELGEIEAALGLLDAVRQSVVVPRDSAAGQRLVAYLLLAEGAEVPTTGYLQGQLRESLPDFMVPSAFVWLNELPLTSNGKVDRGALPEPDLDGPVLEGGYGAPRNPAEETLVELWQEVLGVRRVGVHDNFFELGGDSILSIQLTSRAHRAGIPITARQLFENPTVAGLAALEATRVVADQGRLAGVAPLTPIQAWFFDQQLQDRGRFNMPLALELSSPPTVEVLQRSLDSLLEHHDALRLRYRQQDGVWHQEHGEEAIQVPLEVVDFAALEESQWPEAVRDLGSRLQGELDLEGGPLLRTALCHLPQGAAPRLLLITHHLVVDAVSWRLLLEDLAQGWATSTSAAQASAAQASGAQASRAQALPSSLPPKTTSFQAWAEALAAYATSPAALQELPYWTDETRRTATALPWAPSAEDDPALDLEAHAATVRVSLSRERTEQLLQEVPKAYRTRTDEVLLAALAAAFQSWTVAQGWQETDRLLVDLEGHGREEIFDHVDLSRTVGWFATLYPLLLDLSGLDSAASSSPKALLQRIKEQRRGIPGNGLGYGVLRYLADGETRSRLAELPAAPVLFNYLGQVGAEGAGGSENRDPKGEDLPFRLVPQDLGPAVAPESVRSHPLVINGGIQGGCLEISLTYGSEVFSSATVEALAQGVIAQVERLVDHCRSPEAGGFTPSDFPLARLGQSQLDHLVADRTVEDLFPLSPMQEGMLFHALLEPEAGLYLAHMTAEIHAELDADAFREAWRRLLERHGALRCSFHWDDLDRPLQMVHSGVEVPLAVEDWSELGAGEIKRRLASYCEADRARGFQLNQAPLMRFFIARLSEGRSLMVWTYHQILYDGWSLPILFSELFSFLRGPAAEALQPSPRPYRDYIAWLEKQDMEAAEEYWRGQLKGFRQGTPLGVDSPRGLEVSYDKLRFQMGAEVSAAIQALARRLRLTQSTVMQAAWALLLGRYSGLSDVVFGVTVSGRPAELDGVEKMVGLFINTLPVRFALPAEATVAAWLEELQDRQGLLHRFEYTPLVEIQRWSEIPSGEALFDSFLVFQNYPLDQAVAKEGQNLAVGEVDGEERANYGLTLVVIPGARVALEMEFDGHRFDPATIRRMLGHLEVLLSAMAREPEQPVVALPLLTAAEVHQLRVEWTATEALPATGLFLQRWATQVAVQPSAPAVFCGAAELSYQQLDRRSNHLARRLRAAGAGPGRASGAVVGLCVDRSLEMVVGLLGILKAGCAYLPLDPAYPADRLDWMVQDAGAKVLVTTPAAPLLTEVSTIELGGEESGESRGPEAGAVASLASLSISPQQPAYVIYTSGSTGTPKGVVVSHGSLASYTSEMVRQWGLGPADRFLQFASLSFDVVVEEIFPALEAGGAVVVPEGDLLLSVESLMSVLEGHGVTCAELPAAYWQEWVDQIHRGEATVPESLRLLLLGCEKPSVGHLARWRDAVGSRVDVQVVFGLTETTITNTLHRWPVARWNGAESLPIGQPVARTRLWVVDEQSRPVPVGAVGELYVSGSGVAQGYLGRPGLTASRFVPDPWSAAGTDNGSDEDKGLGKAKAQGGHRTYRTGDRARWRPDGSLEFLGRRDDQLKVRGFRVEPGEIETALVDHPAVARVAVVPKTVSNPAANGLPPANKLQLVAFWVPAVKDGVEAKVDGEALREHLRSRLPDYMVPSSFSPIEELPLTPNGKVDRAALAAKEVAPATVTSQGFRAPRTGKERALAEIFGEVLSVETVGLDDDFFALGGDSILSLQITSRAKRAGLKVTPQQVFEAPTVEALARLAGEIEEKSAEELAAEQSPITGSVPLLPVQRWFFELEQEGPHHYNLPLVLALRDRLDPERLGQALEAVVAHHDGLRASFQEEAGRWRQNLSQPTASASYDCIDLSGLQEDQKGPALERVAGDLQGSFDLADGPLLAAALFDLGAEQRLVFVAHHLIVDNVSWRVVLEDLALAYQQLEQGTVVRLPAKTASLRRWAEELRDWAKAQDGDAEAYWRQESWQEVLPLPVDFSPADGSSARAAAAGREESTEAVEVNLSVAETEDLQRRALAPYRSRLDELLLTALVEAVGSWLGEPLLAVDLEGHGRESLSGDLDLSRTVGWLTTLYPVLLDLRRRSTTGGAIKAVKEQLRQVPHGGTSHGALRAWGDETVGSALRQLPAAQVLYNNLGQVDRLETAELPFRLATDAIGAPFAPGARRTHSLTLETSIREGRLQAVFGYSSEVHRPSTIRRLADGFAAALRSIVEHCLSPDAHGFTPSDFPLAQLDQGSLDQLLGERRGVEDVYPLSPLQQGMLFHTVFEPTEGTYVGQLSVDFHSQLDLEVFRRAWQAVVDRHSSLRTAFHWDSLDRPLQVVLEGQEAAVEVTYRDLRGQGREQQEGFMDGYQQEDRQRGFDLGTAPLLRFVVFQLEDGLQRLVWSFHQLVLDGWSLPILLQDFFTAYRHGSAAEQIHGEGAGAEATTGEVTGTDFRLPPARPYRDYVTWLLEQDLEAAETFWKGQLAGFSEATPLTFDHPPSAQREHRELRRRLSASTTHALQAFARSGRLTLNTLVQASWALALGRRAGRRDVLFGVTVSGRPAELEGADEMVGLLINTLPVRIIAPRRQALLPWLQELQGQQVEIRQYEFSPLAEVQRWSELPAGESLFDTFMVFQNYPVEQIADQGDGDTPVRLGKMRADERSNYALTLVANPGPELELVMEHDARRYDATTIFRMLGHLETQMAAMAAQPERSVADLPLLSPAEAHQLRWEWTATARANPAGLFLNRFAAQAAAVPEAVAVLCGAEHLTYGQLQDQAQLLAVRLQAAGVGPGSVVGLCTERSREMVVGLLGILQAGGAYLPLDPAYPQDRLQFMVEDSGAKLVVTGPGAGDFPSVAKVNLWVDPELGSGLGSSTKPGPNPSPEEAVLSPHQPAYVIYTSGSTGTPKGVVVSHASLASYTAEMVRQWRLGASDRFLQFASLSFDVVVEEIFPALESGGAVVVPQGDLLLSVESLVAVLEEHGVTCAELPAAYWQEWVAQVAAGESRVPESLRLLLLGCEKPAVGRLAQWREAVGSRVDVRVVFGLTETTITNTLERWQPARWDGVTELPIGPPVSNTRLWVVEESSGEASGGTQRPVPLGVVGELYVGGSGVAQGYLGRPALTASRFVPMAGATRWVAIRPLETRRAAAECTAPVIGLGGWRMAAWSFSVARMPRSRFGVSAWSPERWRQ
nr:amino acid adenylation domain-containing protein [Deltaproteobacteria bacterium]